jgi:uncharacterized protein (TIGR03067 family)
VAFRPDGKAWLGAASDGKLYGPDGKGFGEHEGEVTGIAFLPKGGIAVTASKDQTVRFWDVEKKEELARARGPARIMALALSADGKVVAWAASDCVVKVRVVASLLKQGKGKEKRGPSPVGAWVTQRETGAPAAGVDLTITFTADGKLKFDTGKGQVEHGSYKVDDTKDPPEIDYIAPARANPANKKPPLLGIYRVEKDTLTMYLNEKKRPVKFEAPDGSGIMKVTLKRAKKD